MQVFKIMRPSERQDAAASQAVLTIGGHLIRLLGAGLLIWASMRQASAPYFVVSGFGLILAGSLLARRKRAGAWAYLFVVTITLAWAFRDVDHGGSTLVMRLVGPITLLAII